MLCALEDCHMIMVDLSILEYQNMGGWWVGGPELEAILLGLQPW